MTYQVNFTETTNPAKPAIIVEDQSLNIETDITFVGKNYSSYGPVLAENFLHLLENFAKNTAPLQPVQGQLWYDNSTGVNLLKVYDGTTWTAAGSVKKANYAPLVQNSTVGDLWVDNTNNQLYLFSGSTWLLVGPQYSAGLKTGPVIETIIDTENTTHGVISLYSDNYRIAIVSSSSFVPKASISGFTNINKGISLSSADSDIKFQGTSTKADALVVNGSTVSSSNFLRSDATVPSDVQLSIRSDNGINIGSDLSFSIRTDSSSTILTSKTNGKSIDFKLNDSTTVVHLDSSLNVGIGVNNINPSETLDVLGSITVSDKIKVTGTQDSTSVGTGSIITSGGLSVAKKTNFGDSVSFYGDVYVNNLDINGSPTAGAILLPGYATTSPNQPLYDIGSTTHSFRNIYAQQFVGDFTGSFTGTLNGSISGSAALLASPTAFSLAGEVTSDVISFNGQTQNGTAIFNTSISSSIIGSKTQVYDSFLTDELLINRTVGIDAGLKKVTKQTFISNIPTVPVGAIFPFAGLIPPTGYLLCDGGEVRIADYTDLYNVIGYNYKVYTSLVGYGTFGLPDFRGRFALGRDNMDNNTTVPSFSNPALNIDAGGGSADRVTDVSADNIGNHAGSESRTLTILNIPEHKHNMRTNTGQYYAAGLPGGASDPEAEPNLGMPSSSTGYGLRNSGNVDVPINTNLGQAFSVMNPYLTINYIIFTGKI